MAIIAQALTPTQLSESSPGIYIETISRSKGGTSANFFSASNTTPSIYSMSHNNSGERVEAATREKMPKGVERKFALRYHFDSSFNSTGGYRILLQNGHYYEEIPDGFFDAANGGCGAIGSMLMINRGSSNFDFKVQLPDPAAPSRVKCENVRMFTLQDVMGKYVDMVIEQRATDQTNGYYKLWIKIEGGSWQLKVDKTNVRTAWSSFPHAGYMKFGIYSGDPGRGSCTVKTSRIKYSDGQSTFAEVSPDGSAPGSTPPPVEPPVEPPTGTYYKINAGSTSAYQDYQADQYFSTNTVVSSTTTTISGTDDQALYRTSRSSNTNLGSFTYTLTGLPNKTLEVVLHSAEIHYNNPGDRVYSVAANGVAKLTNFDPLATAPKFSALVNTFTADVTNGTLTLTFSASAGRPNVAAIEVKDPAVVEPQVIYKINCGSTAAYEDYAPDQYYSANTVVVPSSAVIAGTTDQSLYQIRRASTNNLGTFQYVFPNVPNGTVQVIYETCETFYTAVGQRVYSISANGVPKLTNYDMLTKAPMRTALEETFEAEVTNGTLTLEFTCTAGKAIVAALTILA